MPKTTMTRRRKLVFATVTVLLATIGALLVLAAADFYLHKKYERTASVNIWGYRGPVVGRRTFGETRVVVLGGSSAFGYGPYWDGAFPHLLEQRLNAAGRGPYVVINLAYNNEGAHAFRPTLEDYHYLDYDLVILYEGYNDVTSPRYQVFRRESAIFRMTGYLPILPMIAKEKAYVMLYGDISQGYSKEQTQFRPGLATQMTASALAAAAITAESIERQLGRLTKDVAAASTVVPTDGCSKHWSTYCGSVSDAIKWARNRGKGVLIGTQPYISDIHIDQQNALMGMLQHSFGEDRGVEHVNLGRAVDLRDRAIAYDGMHLTPAGNQVIADGFVKPVLEMNERLFKK